MPLTGKSFASLAIAYSLFPAALQAAHPLTSDDTGTQGRGNYQFELTAERGHDDAGGTMTETMGQVVTLSYGFHDSADAVVALPHQRVRTEVDGDATTENGRGDTGFAVKWRFFEKAPVSVALKPGVTLPTGDEARGLGSGKAGYSLDLITTAELPPWTFHLHLGYARHRNVVDERENLRHISIGGWRTFNENWRLAFDVGADTNTDKSVNTSPAFLMLGAIYGVNKDLDLDFGVRRGLTNPETDHTLLGGVALRF